MFCGLLHFKISKAVLISNDYKQTGIYSKTLSIYLGKQKNYKEEVDSTQV